MKHAYLKLVLRHSLSVHAAGAEVGRQDPPQEMVVR